MDNKKWQRIQYMPNVPLRDLFVTGSKEHRQLSRKAATEGMVLLKNEYALLPLANGTTLAVFGKAQFDFVKGGGGSGDVTVRHSANIIEGLCEKYEEGKLALFRPLVEFYLNKFPSRLSLPGTAPEPEIPETLLKQARTFTDTALICLCRYSGEEADRNPDDFYLNEQETSLLSRVTEIFPKCIVCLNIGGVINTAPLRDNKHVLSVLLAWQPGMEGGRAIADVLCGDASPNGRLTDTFADSIDAYPSTKTFLASQDCVEYSEDIFVGYRYFETIPSAAERVCYPFGYGLSYTTFDIAFVDTTRNEHGFTLHFTVKNTGARSGRQVVQLYLSAPSNKLDQPARRLIGFAKTAELRPEETEDVSVSFTERDLASYDESASTYCMESGTYCFFAGENVRDAVQLPWSYVQKEDSIICCLSRKCARMTAGSRMTARGSFVEAPAYPRAKPAAQYDRSILPPDGCYPDETADHIPYCAWHNPPIPQLCDVSEGKMTLDEFIDLLSSEQLVNLLGGQPNRGCANTFGIGNIPIYGVPNVMTADGPAGLRFKPECGVTTTAFPCATMLACTWDIKLIEQIGVAAAEELLENGMGVWLAPAANIHRNPLCGRNFEYYSEDPLVSGEIAAAMVCGIQSVGVAASLKHFACNNKEANRRDSDSRMTERALREIYLDGFQRCVEKANPWTIMCSYNILNGVRVSENEELLTGILREEWGYDGIVITDWYTYGVQYAEIAAGVDVKMGCGMPKHTLQMLKEGVLTEEQIKKAAKRVLQMILKLA